MKECGKCENLNLTEINTLSIARKEIACSMLVESINQIMSFSLNQIYLDLFLLTVTHVLPTVSSCLHPFA